MAAIAPRPTFATLSDSLRLFNRKERNILIRAALGNTEMRLGEEFRTQVRDRLQLDNKIDEDAWWGTDYHISWLAGAISLYLTGAPNGDYPTYLNGQRETAGKTRFLIEGNQQDVDLVVASGADLILIEAKGHSSFSTEQIDSKLERLGLLHAFYEQLRRSGATREVRFHLLLASLTEPKKNRRLPEWGSKRLSDRSQIPWIKLSGSSEDLLLVTRCDEQGKSSAQSTYWRCKRA